MDVSEAMTTTEAEKCIEAKIKDLPEKDLVKIVLVGKVDLHSERDLAFLTRKYQERFYFVKIQDKTTLKINYLDYEKDASLKGEFIRMVLKEDLTEAEKKKIIMTGIKALSGEEEIVS